MSWIEVKKWIPYSRRAGGVKRLINKEESDFIFYNSHLGEKNIAKILHLTKDAVSLELRIRKEKELGIVEEIEAPDPLELRYQIPARKDPMPQRPNIFTRKLGTFNGAILKQEFTIKYE